MTRTRPKQILFSQLSSSRIQVQRRSLRQGKERQSQKWKNFLTKQNAFGAEDPLKEHGTLESGGAEEQHLMPHQGHSYDEANLRSIWSINNTRPNGHPKMAQGIRNQWILKITRIQNISWSYITDPSACHTIAILASSGISVRNTGIS